MKCHGSETGRSVSRRRVRKAMEQKTAPQLSFVIPAHNEADGLEELVGEVVSAAEECDRPFEVIFVDDGSGDATADTIRRLAGEDSRMAEQIWH